MGLTLLPHNSGLSRVHNIVDMYCAEGLTDQEWHFLAEALISFMWSEECHQHLKNAVDEYKGDELYEAYND